MTKDVISLSISVLLLFRHYISHKISFGASSSGGVLCSACGAFIQSGNFSYRKEFAPRGSEFFPLRAVPKGMEHHIYHIRLAAFSVTIFITHVRKLRNWHYANVNCH